MALEANTLGLGHIERMAKGLALRRGGSVDVRALVGGVEEGGGPAGRVLVGRVLLPEVMADAKERGFQSFVAKQ
jgi:hypothetical protein